MANGYLKRLFSLRGKVALVTGATGQLGQVICRTLVDAGARVIGTDKALNRKKMVRSQRAHYLLMDICDPGSVAETFAAVQRKFKRLDVLINNAGVSVFEPFAQRTERSFDWVMDVNLKGTFFCIQNFARHAQKNKRGGSIVNIASVYGVLSPDPRIYTDCARNSPEVYGATKAGVVQMTKYFAVHLAPLKVRVNCVSPGGIFNPENPQGKDFVNNYSRRCPMGRMARAGEMAGAVLYLSSDAASYATGQNLVIDGGLSAW